MNKVTAQQIAKQIAQEPLEILKNVRDRVSGDQIPRQGEREKDIKTENYQTELQDKAKSSRLVEAYQRELDDIRRENLFKDLQRKISQGEETPLEDYPELSLEQKQVLKAQMEAVAKRTTANSQQTTTLVEPAAKKGRRLFNFGKKTEVKRQQTRVENIVPPSG